MYPGMWFFNHDPERLAQDLFRSAHHHHHNNNNHHNHNHNHNHNDNDNENEHVCVFDWRWAAMSKKKNPSCCDGNQVM